MVHGIGSFHRQWNELFDTWTSSFGRRAFAALAITGSDVFQRLKPLREARIFEMSSGSQTIPGSYRLFGFGEGSAVLIGSQKSSVRSGRESITNAEGLYLHVQWGFESDEVILVVRLSRFYMARRDGICCYSTSSEGPAGRVERNKTKGIPRSNFKPYG